MACTREQFLNMKTRKDLAAFLEISLKQLGFFAFSHANKYSTFRISKNHSNEKREIKAPISILKDIQRRIAAVVSEVYESENPPEAAHGFRPGRSIATNAKCHVHRAALLNIDLKDFFPSITGGRVRGLFKAPPFSFPDEVADALTNLVCDNGSLPQGAPTSPVISNCICERMDKQLLSFASRNDLVYTRYADDITFSAFNLRRIKRACLNDSCDSLELSEALIEIIEKNGFEVNEIKTRFATRSTRQTVTGVIVNEKCNYKRSEYRELRVLLHNWNIAGFSYAGEMYIAHKPEIAVKITDESDRISLEKLKRHVRGRLAYYTMLSAQNSHNSRSLRKLWTMFGEVSKEKVPMLSPEAATWRLTACYSCPPNDGEEKKDFTAVGSAFKTKGGLLVTAAHCIARINEETVEDYATCEIEFTKPQICRVNAFNRNVDLDYAILSDIPQAMSKANGLTCDPSYHVQVGETVWAYGFADGKRVLRCLEAHVAESYDDGRMIRVDRAFIEGMSGGPVANAKGDVIGIILNGSAAFDYTFDGEFLSIGAIEGFDW